MRLRHPLMMTASLVALSAGLAAPEPSLEQLQEQTRQGDAIAQLALATHYRDGKGVTQDAAEAMPWAHRAAAAGNADAVDFVGFAYLRSAVVKRRPEIAFGDFQAAAKKPAQAALNPGPYYYGGQGTEQDCAKALDGWNKAAAKGHGRAASTAAIALLSGEGVAPGAAEARRLAERAAELNDPSGLIVLGEMQFPAGELDAGRPVVVDFNYIGPQYPGGFAGYTLSIRGYIAAENLYIHCHPAVATPGRQLITSDDWKDFWRSDYYGERAKAVLSRPAFGIESR